MLHDARCHARSGLPRDDMHPRHITLSHAIPSRADSHSASPHIRDASRARVPDVTRSDGHECAIRNVRERKTCRQKVGHYDNGPMQEDQWFSLFCASCTLWIVQHDVHPALFVLSRVRRACVWCACLPWVPAGLACSGARAGFLADFPSLARVPGRVF